MYSISVERFSSSRMRPSPHPEIDTGQSIFEDLCEKAKATGNLAQDAWFAALAIEPGCEWITTDRDYARFPGLSWRSPF